MTFNLEHMSISLGQSFGAEILQSEAQLSIAISLKRIADHLTAPKTAQPFDYKSLNIPSVNDEQY